MKAKIIIFIILNAFGFLLATLGVISSPYFWPATVIEVVGAILFGWTGVLAGTTFPIFSNIMTNQPYTSVIVFIIPAFIQGYLPFYLFRRFNCDISLKNVKAVLWFVLTSAIVPILCGGILASIGLLSVGKITTTIDFLWFVFGWIINGIPWVIIFGIPLIKIFAPILREHGLLFGQEEPSHKSLITLVCNVINKIKNIKAIRAKIIIFIILNIFGFLLGTLGVMSCHAVYDINLFWPAGVIETTGAILFGWTGVLAGITFPIFSNMVTDPTYTSALCYILPSFVQSYLPFYLFRKFNCDIKLSGIKAILLFSLLGAIIPQLSGGILASLILLGIGKITMMGNFCWMIFLWFADGVPSIIIFGILFIKIFAPILKDYGLLFGQPEINKISANKNVKISFKNLPIFLKIFSSLLIVGVVPVNVLGAYEIIISKEANTAGFNINAIFICFGFFATLILTGILTKAITSPIKKLSQGIKEIGSGDFDYRVEATSDDELGELANAFNNMSKTVKENIQQKEIYMEKVAEQEKLAALWKTAAQVSHDIRSPLAALSTVLNNLSELPEQKRILIRNATNRISDIANNLLSQYRITDSQDSAENNQQPILKPELVSSLLESLISEKRAQMTEKTVDLILEINNNAHGCFVNLEANKFKRIISNLINNGAEAIIKEGVIDVCLTKKQGSLIIEVIDNGKGIPEEVLPRIKQGGVSINKDNGHGLGISGAIANIRKWNGNYDIQSKEGKGTTFIITLPISDSPKWFQRDISVLPNTHVIILDDDESIHNIWEMHFKDQLKINQIAIDHFYRPSALLEYCKTSFLKNDLFLIDYELIGFKETGLDLIEQLNLKDQAILVTSRYEESIVREKAEKLGVKIIPKNFAPYIKILKGYTEQDDTELIKSGNELVDLIFIDDDIALTMAWEMRANLKGKKIKTFNSSEDFKKVMLLYSKDTPVYIDSSLGELIPGEEVARYLYEQGFHNLYLATGYQKSDFKEMAWIKEIVGKEPPF